MKRLPMLVVCAVLLAPMPAGAQDTLQLEAFLGRWEGSALGRRADEPTVGYGIRDLDVQISGTDDGFQITWITISRVSGLASPDAEVKRRVNSQNFVRVGPAVWKAEGVEGPGASFSYSWARLQGRSFHVYVLEIDEGGIYQLSHYNRTISRAGVMDLKYTRTRDGTVVRRVTGHLMPASD